MNNSEQVNTELREIYEEFLPIFFNQLYDISTEIKSQISCPLFIHAFDEFSEKDNIKIMIVGKETCGWGKITELENLSFEEATTKILGKYQEFCFGRENIYWKKSAFWRFNFEIYEKLRLINSKNQEKFIGNILIDNQHLERLCNDFSVDDFTENELIFNAIQELFAKNEPIDVLTVANLLKRKNELEKVGGLKYLAQMSSFGSEYQFPPKGIIWTNISKIDLNKTKLSKELIEKTLQLSVKLLEKEINIIQPDILIFIGDNPKYWRMFAEYFGSNEGKFDSNDIYWVKSDKFPSKTKAFWTFHPQAKSKERIKNVIEKLISKFMS